VSTVRLKYVGVAVFHAESVSVILRVLLPSPRAGEIVQLQSPLLSIVAVHASPFGPVTVIRFHGIPVPVIVGVVLFVAVPFHGEVSIGEVGAVVSIVIVNSGETEDSFPASSVWVYDIWYTPSERALLGLTDSVPTELQACVPITPVPEYRVIVFQTSVQSTSKVGTLSFVKPSLLEFPVSLADWRSRVDGVVGAIVSTINVVDAVDEVFPPLSVVLTLNVVLPSPKDVEEVRVQSPFPSTTPVPTRDPLPSSMVNIVHGSPVPVIVGVLVLTKDPLPGVRITTGVGAVESIVNVLVVTEETFPALSVVLTLSVILPSGSDVDEVRVQSPFPSTTPVPTSDPLPSNMVNIVPASPVPVMVGVVSFVVIPLVGLLIIGVDGTIVSIVRERLVGEDVFPEGSFSVTTKAFVPSPRAGDMVQFQSPLLSTVALHVSPFGPVTVIESPVVPVPVSVGVLSFILAPFVGELTVGASGAVESIVKVVVAADEVFPATSFVVILKVVLPAGKGIVGVRVQSPLPSTTPVPTSDPLPSSMVNTVHDSPVPVISGVLSLIVELFAGVDITGEVGEIQSGVQEV